MTKIKKIVSRQIFDSIGNPTVETDVITTNNVIGRAAVPSGASTGEHESVELRDGLDSYMGKSVFNAVKNVNEIISKELNNLSIFDHGLEELTLTTNATQLAQHADELASVGVKRVNVSLDTRDRDQFAKLSRRDALPRVLEGLAAANEAGLRVKINTVALKGVNEHELPDLIAWAHGEGFDHTLIEVMPLGDVDEDRVDHFLPLSAVREQLEQRWTLTPLSESSGGPARYDRIEETGGKLGMITPLTNNFCAGCNRLRVTATGQLYPCLGGGERVDLRAALRSDDPEANLQAALNEAMRIKPEWHHFDISERGAEPAQPRHMSMTGG